jgi:hypothetical protein
LWEACWEVEILDINVERSDTPMSFTLTSGVLTCVGTLTKLLIERTFLTLLSPKFGVNGTANYKKDPPLELYIEL